ncbi:MAG: protein-glutamate O-methyltransferase CheR [Treponema sp.]|nr:protein-glutamate O-methyltransferase CheR [Treponema sp.]
MLQITKKQLDTIRDLAYKKYGLFIGPDKVSRLLPKLERFISNEGYSGADDLCSHLASEDRVCLEKFISYITTCHTFFFREPEHFKELAADIHHSPQASYSIWCAASSTGEEPYSIAMTLIEDRIRNFHIVASDLNRDVLAEFNRGVYHESRLAQTPVPVKDRYFTAAGDDCYTISGSLRRFISIKNINLMDSIHFPQPFDYVFCRNVFIYFDEQSRSQAVSTIISNLKIGGSLFIGHAEVLLQQPENLKKIGSSIYRRMY